MSETELCALCQKPIKTARVMICLNCLATQKVVSLEWLEEFRVQQEMEEKIRKQLAFVEKIGKMGKNKQRKRR